MESEQKRPMPQPDSIEPAQVNREESPLEISGVQISNEVIAASERLERVHGLASKLQALESLLRAIAEKQPKIENEVLKSREVVTKQILIIIKGLLLALREINPAEWEKIDSKLELGKSRRWLGPIKDDHILKLEKGDDKLSFNLQYSRRAAKRTAFHVHPEKLDQEVVRCVPKIIGLEVHSDGKIILAIHFAKSGRADYWQGTLSNPDSSAASLSTFYESGRAIKAVYEIDLSRSSVEREGEFICEREATRKLFPRMIVGTPEDLKANELKGIDSIDLRNLLLAISTAIIQMARKIPATRREAF